jgi:hypothetical protein
VCPALDPLNQPEVIFDRMHLIASMTSTAAATDPVAAGLSRGQLYFRDRYLGVFTVQE